MHEQDSALKRKRLEPENRQEGTSAGAVPTGVRRDVKRAKFGDALADNDGLGITVSSPLVAPPTPALANVTNRNPAASPRKTVSASNGELESTLSDAYVRLLS